MFASLQIALQNRFADQVAFLSLPVMTLELGIALSIGAMAGDLIGSIIKRQMSVERGDSFLLLDQLDFIVVAIALAYVVQPFHILIALSLVLLTPPIHVLSNIFGYHAKLKKHPW